MSYTDLGYSVFHGKKALSHGFDTYGEARKALLRIAATENYAFEFLAMFQGRMIKNKLPKNWKTLTIKKGADYGGGATYRTEGRISRSAAEKLAKREKAKPYKWASNIKHLKRPKELKASFERNGEKFRFVKAYIDEQYGLEIVYRGVISSKALEERLKDKTPQTETLKQLWKSEEDKPIACDYHITSAESADKWKEAGLSKATFRKIERRESK